MESIDIGPTMALTDTVKQQGYLAVVGNDLVFFEISNQVCEPASLVTLILAPDGEHCWIARIFLNMLHAVEPDEPLEMFPIDYVTV